MVERLLSFRSRRFWMLFLVVMLAFAPVMRAYADDYEGGGGASSSFNNNFGTVWYGPTGTGGIANTLYVRYGVVANTQYDAALYCCRGSNFDLSDLSAAKKYKLLNNGDFYQFANLFRVGKPEETDDWRGDANVVLAWNSARQMYGETYCYSGLYTNDQKIRAQDAINRIMAESDEPTGGGGGDTSGGSYPNGGAPAVGEDVVFLPVEPWASSDYDIDYIMINRTTYDNLKDYCDTQGEGYHIYSYVGAYVNSASQICGCVWACKEDQIISYGETPNDAGRPYVVRFMAGARRGWQNLSISAIDYEGKRVADCRNGRLIDSSSSVVDGIYPIYFRDFSDTPVEPDPPTEPPAPWPDPPQNPVGGEPDVPGPGDPIVPTPPDPPNPWEPIPGIDIDITGDDFQDLLDALNEHCIHLQTAIQDNISQLWGLQSDLIEAQIEWLGNDVIIASFTDLKDYLHELFEWLAQQMQFDVNVEGGQYDDTSVIYWLKQIWGKLPTGINTRPTDPVTNPTGWWDWFTQLLNNLAADLMALGHDRLANLLEMLNQLRNKFPFSLPWDIAALLGLLVAVPECPEFDVPAYSLGSNMELAEVGTYHITLEPYEDVWEGVKWIETLAFAVYLITHTGGLMDMVTKTVRPR